MDEVREALDEVATDLHLVEYSASSDDDWWSTPVPTTSADANSLLNISSTPLTRSRNFSNEM